METHCPKCKSENIYQDAPFWICPECSYEWPINTPKPSIEAVEDTTIRDSNGTALADGDSVIVLKDLKVKGSSSTVKGGTKVRNIRLYDGDDGHNISCKIEGIGSVNLKSQFVRKS